MSGGHTTGQRVVAVANPAGSTAKSTTVAALGHLAAQAGVRVLLVDVDPQGNLTDWVSGRRDTAGITQALMAAANNDPARWPGVPEADILADRISQTRRTIQKTSIGCDLIAGDVELRATVSRWSDLGSKHPETLLAAALDGHDYDLVLIDCKGDLGALTEAALHAASEVIGVATPSMKALKGLGLLSAEVDSLAGEREIRFRSVIPVQIRPRNRGAASDDLYLLMQDEYAGRISPPVRGASGLEEAYAGGAPITAYAPGSGISEDYRQVYAWLRDEGVLP